MLENIPIELRLIPQWVAVDMSINAETGLPWKRPIDPKTNYFAVVTDPRTWGTFEQAVGTGRPVGFVLTKDDKYAIIDLDNKPHKPATPEQLEIHNQILTGVESYIERSISKTGHHVVIYGSVPSGVNFGNIELYSDGRMMIFTGDVVKNLPIADYHEAINNMYIGMRAAQERLRPRVELEQVDGHMEDGDIFAMGSDAVNGDKFNKLCRGEWQDFGFPSQSEADLALMSMFAFYSKDNEQCRRLFRMTVLGKREKYQKDNNHLDRILGMIRSKEPAPVDIADMEDRVAAVLAEVNPEPTAPIIPRVPAIPVLSVTPGVIPNQVDPAKTITGPLLDILQPPGVLSIMADYMYAQAPRQVREYAVCAAISMLAGICARAYNVSGTGLNQYLIILGGPGTGKESMASGIGKLTKAINEGILDAKSVDIGTFASVQGIHKALLNQPCALSILGEVGHEFKIMLSPKVDPNRLEIKKAYLNLYNKSGEGESYSPVTYSKTENNMAAVASPNLSILGESTPIKFFECVTEASASDGFLSRLMIMEYTGVRHDYNEAKITPPEALTKWLCAIRDHANDLQARNIVEHIKIEPTAKAMLNQYDRDITAKINTTINPGLAELLVRSHVKVLKLAALGAVAINHYNPVITIPLAEWAIAFVNKSDSILTTRFQTGEIGEMNDSQFEAVMRKCITAYIKMTPKQKINSKCSPQLAETHFIPFTAIRDYCQRREPFKSHKLGPAGAIEIAIKDLLKANIIYEVPASQLPKPNTRPFGQVFAIGEHF